MEISKNSISLEKKLNSGEVTCRICKNGKYKPLNPNFNKNHYFICSNCGDRIIIEPNVIVE